MLKDMKRFASFVLACSLAAPVAHAACGPIPDHSAAMAAAIEQLQNAKNEREAQVFNALLWEFWLDAPDARAKAMLEEGMSRRRVFDLAGAVVVFSELIEYCPDYAEGWNQRAFAFYLQTDFERALADLDETLARNPEHIGALSGKALTLMGMGRAEVAQDVLREALALNPWLAERVYLADTDREPPGQDL
jgi:tetratricopeptide (TPR) repeat protein